MANAQLPRIADYKYELSSLARVTSAYLKKLQDYPKWVRDSIDKHGGSVDRVEKDLADLSGATSTAASTYANKESRGRKKNEPRLKLIQQLKRIFTKYSVRGKYKATTAKIKRDRKYAEQNFVEDVFDDAGIPVPKTIARMLRAR